MSNVPYEGMKEEDLPDPGDIFDLPGVPWNIFFDLAGTAIHGAYWHNDFGIRRSHGCLNVPCRSHPAGSTAGFTPSAATRTRSSAATAASARRSTSSN